MASASFKVLLVQTLEVYRRSGKIDRLGQPIEPNLGDPFASYPCRMTSGTGGETNTERSRDLLEVLHTCFVAPEADVREDDTVRIMNPDATELLALSDVKLKRQVYNGIELHHLELKLEVQRGPTA